MSIINLKDRILNQFFSLTSAGKCIFSITETNPYEVNVVHNSEQSSIGSMKF